MRDINQWLLRLKSAWEQCDVEAAVDLFSNDVEYWETPFSLVSPDKLHELWQGIKGCIGTEVTTSVYASEDNKFSVIWHATWNNLDDEKQEKGGTYYVTLNDDGKCSYFYRTSILKEKN